LPSASKAVLQPRKTPVQARSTASVNAILEATIQVLLEVGKERLTTTRVAYRAGVSVGTLYQYFPNKGALLQAALKNHLELVADAVERVCREERGGPPSQMVTRIVDKFLEAKMKDIKTSVALYSVSSDVEGSKIVEKTAARMNKAITCMLATTREPLQKDPQLVASMIQSAMAGVSRKLLESSSPDKQFMPLKQELILMLTAYLDASL
jgi:AcrR family transcriptional regulator